MSEDKTKQNKMTAKVILGGEEITAKKLKAGKFYEAQKVISQLFRDAGSLLKKDEKADVSQKEVERKVKEQVAEGKIPDIKDVDMAGLVSMFDKFPQHISRFVAICVEMTHEELLDKAYPEEINKAFAVCFELNNVMENLKNSVAPMEKLGASGPKAK